MADNLPTRAWYPYNHQTLRQLLNASFQTPCAAVFDWDNTCIFNDIGDACFRYQLEHFVFALAPHAAAELLRMPCALTPQLHSGTAPHAFAQDILAAYTKLWQQTHQEDTSEHILETNAHQDLCAKLGAFYEDMLKTPSLGPQFAYTWVLQWYSGLTHTQIQTLTEHAIAQLQTETIGRATWSSQTPGSSGHKRYHYNTHLAPITEMRELLAACTAAGIQSWVVSASLEPIVQAAAKTLQYPINAEHIIGMRLQQDAAGRMLPQMRSGHPVTYRIGKVEAIYQYIQAPIVLVAGDAITDLEMLLHAPKATRLVIHRNCPEAEMQQLYAAAQAYQHAYTTPHYQGAVLLQGRNPNQGCFVPDMHSHA